MTDPAATARPPDLVSGDVLARGFAALRIFFGLIWHSNGLAKLIGVGAYDLGFATFGLLDLGTAQFIANDASTRTYLGPLAAFYRTSSCPTGARSVRSSRSPRSPRAWR